MDAIIDKFGEKVKVANRDDGTFEITETIAVSNVFYSWVFGFGEKVRIISPKIVRSEYLKLIKESL